MFSSPYFPPIYEQKEKELLKKYSLVRVDFTPDNQQISGTDWKQHQKWLACAVAYGEKDMKGE